VFGTEALSFWPGVPHGLSWLEHCLGVVEIAFYGCKVHFISYFTIFFNPTAFIYISVTLAFQYVILHFCRFFSSFKIYQLRKCLQNSAYIFINTSKKTVLYTSFNSDYDAGGTYINPLHVAEHINSDPY
jgi:hypothetical protein